MIHPRHLSLRDIYISMRYTSMGLTCMGHTPIKLKKSLILTRLICVLNKYSQKQNLEVDNFLFKPTTVLQYGNK